MYLHNDDEFKWTCETHGDQTGFLEVENGVGYWKCQVEGCQEDEVVVNI